MTQETEQAKTLRKAKAVLQLTSEGLAMRLGVEPGTLLNWLLPMTSKRHREMPKTAKLLLAYILKEHRAVKREKGEKKGA